MREVVSVPLLPQARKGAFFSRWALSSQRSPSPPPFQSIEFFGIARSAPAHLRWDDDEAGGGIAGAAVARAPSHDSLLLDLLGSCRCRPQRTQHVLPRLWRRRLRCILPLLPLGTPCRSSRDSGQPKLHSIGSVKFVFCLFFMCLLNGRKCCHRRRRLMWRRRTDSAVVVPRCGPRSGDPEGSGHWRSADVCDQQRPGALPQRAAPATC